MPDTVHNPHPEVIAEIERLNLEAEQLCRSIEETEEQEERKTLDRQLRRIQQQLQSLKEQ